MSGKGKSIFVQAISSGGQVSSKRLLGFEAFHVAVITLAAHILVKVICNIDLDLKPYFDSLLIFTGGALGITAIEKFSPKKTDENNG